MPTIPTERARIQYWRTGSGPAVILVQGAGVIGEGWRPQIDGLKERYTVIWIDNRGIGQSVITAGPLRVDDMAADVLAVADVERLQNSTWWATRWVASSIPGAGHAVTIQCAADVNALLTRHLREASAGGA